MKLTRLDKLRLRLVAQDACLGWAFREIEAMPGVVFELGLGHGRTYDHLRTHLPDRDIYVFDRELDCFEDCTPPENRMIVGDMRDTVPAAAERFAGQVALLHADTGSYGDEHNSAMQQLLSAAVAPALAPGGLLVSDLNLDVPGTQPVPLPPGATEGRYFIYRAQR
ncbi:MAG: class I SAM-dependent methyltransferase [Rhizobiaceae bacterium]|nr:class I SAM-dependent methyltransferase [Rhizobiaceae bacterium]